jgi:protein tyrosine phosphatase
MVCEQHSSLVVMLSDDQSPRAAQLSAYLDSPSGTISDDILASREFLKITKTAEYVLDDGITLRTLCVRHRHHSKDSWHQRWLTHLQFSQWTDNGTPKSLESFLKFFHVLEYLREKLAVVNGETKPIVVHCSAGCGRTGSLLTILSVLENLQSSTLSPKTPPLSPPLSPSNQTDEQHAQQQQRHEQQERCQKGTDLIVSCVRNIRRQRMYMVQTSVQFLFVYCACFAYFDYALQKRVQEGVESVKRVLDQVALERAERREATVLA